MKEINNFKELEKENILKYNAPNKRVISDINSSLSTFQFIGHMVDLFFTKLIGATIAGHRQDKKEKPSKYPNAKD